MSVATGLGVLILVKNVLICQEHIDASVKMATINCGMETVKVCMCQCLVQKLKHIFDNNSEQAVRPGLQHCTYVFLHVIIIIIVDIDECTTDPKVCEINEKCVNKAGGYSCQCEQGFRRNDRGKCRGIIAQYICELLPLQ